MGALLLRAQPAGAGRAHRDELNSKGNPSEPRRFITLHGVGYKLVVGLILPIFLR
jgi:hypothetical protein